MYKRIITFMLCITLCVSCVAIGVINQKADDDTYIEAAAEGQIEAIAADFSDSNRVGEAGSLLYKGTEANEYYLKDNVTITKDEAKNKTNATYEALLATFNVTEASATAKTLNGNGKTITTEVPLFNGISNCTIKNLTVESNNNIDFTKFTAVTSEDYDAYSPLAAMTYGDITFNKVTVNVSCDYKNAESMANGLMLGGFIGKAQDGSTVNFTDCKNLGNIDVEHKISSTKKTAIGGFIGWAGEGAKTYINFKNCANEGKIDVKIDTTVNGGGFVGGFVGATNYGEYTAENSVNKGNITGESNTPGGNIRIAGFLGHSQKGPHNFTYCMNLGDIIVDGPTNVRAAGFMEEAANSSAFTNCVNIGDVTNKVERDGQPTSGFAYSNGKTLTLTNCINAGTITVEETNTKYVGGLISRPGTKENYSNCYSIKQYNDNNTAAIKDLSTVFTTVNAASNGTFTTSVDKTFYGIISDVVNTLETNGIKLDFEFGGIITLKNYDAKIAGDFTHKTFDDYYTANKTALSAKGVSSLYMNATFRDGRATQNLTAAELVDDKYVVNVVLLNPTENVEYIARTFIKIGSAYIYSK